VVLGFELGSALAKQALYLFFFFFLSSFFNLLLYWGYALYLLSHTSNLFCSSYFGDGVSNHLPRLASNHDLPNLSFPSS
jgi:hypothetical protein